MLGIFKKSAPLALLAVVALACSSALGDPLPGQVLKFQQLPMISTTVGDPTPTDAAVYYGHDERSTARLVPGTPQYQGVAMADDFADLFDTPVVHVRWWGSYLNEKDNPDGFLKARKFLISFETDVPAGTDGNFSHPGTPLQSEVVSLGPLSPGSGTFTESLVRPADPLLGESLYMYNAELALPFDQNPDTVYWLKIVALDDQADPTQTLDWGWHNRDYTIFDQFASSPPNVLPGESLVGQIPLNNGTADPIWHFQDDSVSSQVVITSTDLGELFVEQSQYQPQRYVSPYDGPELIGEYSKDLAFELYTYPVPEPSTLALIGVGLFCLTAYQRRRRTGSTVSS